MHVVKSLLWRSHEEEKEDSFFKSQVLDVLQEVGPLGFLHGCPVQLLSTDVVEVFEGVLSGGRNNFSEFSSVSSGLEDIVVVT